MQIVISCVSVPMSQNFQSTPYLGAFKIFPPWSWKNNKKWVKRQDLDVEIYEEVKRQLFHGQLVLMSSNISL